MGVREGHRFPSRLCWAAPPLRVLACAACPPPPRIRRLHSTLGGPLPEMVFEGSGVVVHHVASGLTLSFLAVDALQQCLAPGDEPARVAYAAPPNPMGCVSLP
jgi:hypothetical protein